jgi:FHA domain/Domain of unknown function (DUF1707)
VRVLRDAAVDGRLAHESFVRRIDFALRARHQHALSDLVADLGKSPGSGLDVGQAQLSKGARRHKGNYYPPLVLPSQAVLLVGRAPSCDFIVEDRTASRLHAVLVPIAGKWLISDHASTNGTFINGRRLAGAVFVRPGDRASFGLATYRLMSPW